LSFASSEPSLRKGFSQQLSDVVTAPLPLAVDMDGTLIRSDMSIRTLRSVVLPRPWLWAKMLWLEFSGQRPRWKREFGARLAFDPAQLDYNQPFLDWLHEQKQAGREIILATASNEALATKVADHVGIFDSVLGTRDGPNLRQEVKRDALNERYGEGKYAYAGNSAHDFPVWEGAGEVIVVNAPPTVLAQMAHRDPLIFD